MISSSAGKTVRMARLFRADRRSLTLALDHPKARGMIRGLRDVGEILDWALGPATDAVLMNPGMFRRHAHRWRDRSASGVILALDIHFEGSIPGERLGRQAYRMLSTIGEAVALGADAVKVVLVFGRSDLEVHASNYAAVSAVVRESDAWGMPVMIEPVLWGDGVTPAQLIDPEIVASMCRVAVELGADIVKAPYVAGVFRELCRVLPVPITLLGGGKTDHPDDVYRTARQALVEGVAGLTFGRNVWQHAEPESVWNELNAIVHGAAMP